MSSRATPAASPRSKPGRSGKGSKAPAAVVEKPVRHRTAMVRKAMLDVAAELFAERGYVGTNLRDVADALGMSRPGLYYHFPSKEKLLEAIVEELTLSAERQLASIVANPDSDPEEALRQVVDLTTQWLLSHQVFFRVLDRSEADIPADLREANEAAKRTILDYFVEIVERGIEIGRFRPIDPHVAALVISGMRNWAAWWYKPDGRFSIKEIAAIISEMAVSSVLRPDAHRSRSQRVGDVLRILQEDVTHLSYLLKG